MDREEHLPGNGPTPFARRKDPDRSGRPSGRDQHRRSCAAAKGIAEALDYSWSKEFLEVGKRRLVGDTSRAATSGEVKDLRREASPPKVVVAEQALELRLH